MNKRKILSKKDDLRIMHNKNKHIKLQYFIAIFYFLCSSLVAQKMTLLTYNIRLDTDSDGENAWKYRKDFLCSQIQFYEPDIFGIQEALPSQVAFMAEYFAQYEYIGVGRDANNQGESSNIFYKKDRFCLIKSNTFWLSETPDKVSKGWDAAINRVCTYGLFYDSLIDVHFLVFNTHFDHIGEIARAKSIHLILNKIEELNQNKYPVFFMGDFNLLDNSPVIESLNNLMDDSRYITKNKPFGPKGTFNGFQHNMAITNRIDYIFLSKNNPYTVNKYAVLSDHVDIKYPSDHLPVYIEVSKKNLK